MLNEMGNTNEILKGGRAESEGGGGNQIQKKGHNMERAGRMAATESGE